MFSKPLAQKPLCLFAKLSWVSYPPVWDVCFVFGDTAGGLREVNPGPWKPLVSL